MIAAGGIEWTIQLIDPRGSHVRFEVVPTTRAQEALYTVSFKRFVTASIDYVRIAGHYTANPEIQGFFSNSGYSNLVLDQDAYGTDLQAQEAAISDDWDIQSYLEL